MAHSLKMRLSALFFFIVLYNSVMLIEALRKTPALSEILQNLESLPASLLEIKDVPSPRFEHLESVIMRPFGRWDPTFAFFFASPSYINQEYKKLKMYKNAKRYEATRLTNLHIFANQSTSHLANCLSDHLTQFKKTLIPNFLHEGIFHRYSNYINDMDEENNQWCEAQSFNYFLYASFKFSLNIIRKGYSIVLQSYIVRDAFDEEGFEAYINQLKKEYKSTVEQIFDIFRKILSDASTRIARCDPPKQIRNKTYLEMEKLLQGTFPPEVTLNYGRPIDTCADYDSNIPYHPHAGIGDDKDWKCYGKMYDCFELKPVREICKTTTPSRRIDGLIRQVADLNRDVPIIHYEAMGDLKHCSIENRNLISHPSNSTPRIDFSIRRCACICDDSEHPNTLRRFSRKYVLSDYKKNMVVTGMRLVNISNIIHIQIQEGKLEQLGFINPSTVQWKSDNELHSIEIMNLSYYSRRVDLDAFHLEPNQVVIGAAFDMDSMYEGVMLSVFFTDFIFSTGELDQEYQKRSGSMDGREEIVLGKSHMPTMGSNNFRVTGDNKFINFQTTDWQRDAAQTTIPYLDIQEVVTDPPTMLRGIGLYYKRASGCGGYIGLELYSHEYRNLIVYNETLYGGSIADRMEQESNTAKMRGWRLHKVKVTTGSEPDGNSLRIKLIKP